MKLEYCRSETYNFGDDLNAWIWPKLLGDKLDERSDTYFLGIGTILTEKRLYEQLKGAKKIVIFSSGAWDENIPKLDERCQVFGVRGPRTAAKLGLDSSLIVGDGAYLLRKVALPVANIQSGVGFVPHHRSEDFIDWQRVCDLAGVTFISAKQPVDDFLAALQGCDKVVTEAMHGAITADALRIPWVAAKFSPAFNEEKWYDFAESMDLDITFFPLPFMAESRMGLSKALVNQTKRWLSQVVPCPTKWSRLPVLFKSASDLDIEQLSLRLKSLATDAPVILSTEEKVDEVTEKQFQTIQAMRKQL